VTELSLQSADDHAPGTSSTNTNQDLWKDLATSIIRKLKEAGFRHHEHYGDRGGFCVTVLADCVQIGWALGEYADEDDVSPFELTVMSAVIPAIEQILKAMGFTTRIIPDEEDNGGDIRVTGWQGSPAA
jgi:hypothetical protein